MRGCTLRVGEGDPVAARAARRGRRAGRPVRSSSERKPSTASRPLVVPERARIASQACSTRSSDGRPSAGPPRTTPFCRASQLDLLERLPGGALDGVAELSTQRPERAELRRHGRVVALDHEQLRHRLARHRLALAGAPVAHLAERLRDLVGRVVQRAERRRGRGGRRGASRPARENSSATSRNASQSVFASHGGAIAALKVCTNGCRSVEERSTFSYQVAAGSTTSEKSAFEVIRKSIVVSRSSLPVGAGSRQATSAGRSSSGGAPRRAPPSSVVPSRCRRKYS